MGKKGERNQIGDFVRAGLTTLSDVVVTNIFTRLRSETDILLDQIERRALVIQRRITTHLTVSLLLGATGVFFLLALLFFLTEQLGWSKALTFLILGGITLLIGIALRTMRRAP